MFECVLNLSEGRDLKVLTEIGNAGGASLRDLHHDPVHHRSVATLVNEAAPLFDDVRSLVRAAFDRLDLRTHHGVHPRFGVVDVIPFVAYHDDETVARELRARTASWLASTFDVPVFFYDGALDSEYPTLPDVRRRAFVDLAPDAGPPSAHERLGAAAIGVRDVLVAWNLWLRDCSPDETRRVAARVRSREVRALGFDLGEWTQVSCNLVAPTRVGPGAVFDQVTALVGEERVARGELVGLLPEAVLRAEETSRWDELGLSAAATIEARLNSN